MLGDGAHERRRHRVADEPMCRFPPPKVARKTVKDAAFRRRQRADRAVKEQQSRVSRDRRARLVEAAPRVAVAELVVRLDPASPTSPRASRTVRALRLARGWLGLDFRSSLTPTKMIRCRS